MAMKNELLNGINSMVEESKAEVKPVSTESWKFDAKKYPNAKPTKHNYIYNIGDTSITDLKEERKRMGKPVDEKKNYGFSYTKNGDEVFSQSFDEIYNKLNTPKAQPQHKGSILQEKLSKMNTATDIEKEVFKNLIGKKETKPNVQNPVSDILNEKDGLIDIKDFYNEEIDEPEYDLIANEIKKYYPEFNRYSNQQIADFVKDAYNAKQESKPKFDFKEDFSRAILNAMSEFDESPSEDEQDFNEPRELGGKEKEYNLQTGTQFQERSQTTKGSPNESAYDFVKRAYPSEFQTEQLRKDISLSQLWEGMKKGQDIYKIASIDGNGFDSEVREELFNGISEATGVPYDTIYRVWLHGSQELNKTQIASEYGKNGLEVLKTLTTGDTFQSAGETYTVVKNNGKMITAINSKGQTAVFGLTPINPQPQTGIERVKEFKDFVSKLSDAEKEILKDLLNRGK